MQPKKRKHAKEFRGSMHGLAWRGSELTYGEYGLQAMDRGWVTAKQIEAARRAVVHTTARKGRVWLKLFPQKPVTAKSAEVTRGGGKGDVSHYVAVVRPGRVLLEVGGLDAEVSLKSLKLAAQKFPMRTRIIKKD